MQKLLKRVGIQTVHEGMGKHGSISPIFAVHDYWYPTCHGGARENFEFKQVWHQIRHPLGSIASIANDLPGFIWHWQEKHSQVYGNIEPPERRAALFWLRWTELCRKQEPDWTYRIEDIEEVWPEMCRRLDMEPIDLPSIPVDTGTSKAERLTWEKLADFDKDVADEVRQMAERYGYTD